MGICSFRARIGVVAKPALLAAALVTAGAVGCGKKQPNDPRAATEPPASETGKKTEAPKPSEKPKPVPGMTDLTAVAGSGWDIQADPGPAIDGKLNLRDAIPFDSIVMPAAPSAFAAVGVPRAKDTYRVYDLRTMDAVGERVVVPAARGLALSPDGKHLATWQAKGPGVEVYSTQTGKRVFTRDMDKELGLKATWMGLPGGDRLWAGLPLRAQVWDITERKRLVSLSDVLLARKAAAFSPTGRYLLTVRPMPLANSPPALTVWDLHSGKVVGERSFQATGAPKGAPAGVAFSPDGEEVAMLWRLDAPPEGLWGRVVSWDVKTGKKLHDHPLRAEDLHSDVDALTQTDKRIVQFWPGRRGWMLFGYVLIDRESGAVIRAKELGLPRDEGDMQDRRFLDADHVTEARNRAPRALKVVRLPKAEIEDAVKAARGAKK